MSPSGRAAPLAVHRWRPGRGARGLIIFGTALAAAIVTALPAAGAAAAGHPRGWVPKPHVGPVTEISRRCPGPNAEAEPAVDGRSVYVPWIGCNRRLFAP